MSRGSSVAVLVAAACASPVTESTTSQFVEGPGIPSADRPASELFERVSPVMGSRHFNQPAVVNQTLFLGGNAVHEMWNISNPSAPVRMSELVSAHSSGEAESHQLTFARFSDGSLHAATISGRGVDLWNISNPSQPVLESTLVLGGIDYGDFTSAVWGVTWQGQYLYVGGTNTGLHIIDARDPTAPVVIKRVPTSAFGGISAGPLFAIGNLLVITTPKESSGIATLDISDPRNPTLLDVVDPEATSYIGGFYGKNAYLMDPFRTYDVTTDPRNIAQLGSASVPKTEYVSFGDGHAFLGGVRILAAGRGGIYKFALGDPSSMTQMGHVQARNLTSDDQFSLPIGNLVVVADDEDLFGAWLAVHDTARDTRPPEVVFTSPAAGSANQALTSRIGISLSDHVELTSVTEDALIVRPVGGAPVPGRVAITGTVLSFSPATPLDPGVTYEVVLAAGGITDLVGNGLATEVKYTFTTIATPLATPGCAIQPLAPVVVGAAASASANNPDESRYAYSFRFGDGTSGEGATVAHAYAQPGRYPVALTVREKQPLANGPQDDYEAERAVLYGGVAERTEEGGYSGPGYADYPDGQGANVKLAWTSVVANAGGAHDVTIRFGNGDSATRRLRLRVNGGAGQVLEFAPTQGDWGFRSKTVTVSLIAGINTLELVADAGTKGPNIDRLSVPLIAAETCLATQIVHRPLTPTSPTRSSTIVAHGGRVYVISSDADAVIAFDLDTLAKVFETRVGDRPRTLAVAPGNRLVVANQDDDSLTVLDAATGAVLRTVTLPYGSRPYGVVFSPDGSRGFVSLQGSGRVLAIDATGEPGGSVDLDLDADGQRPKPRGLAVTADSSRVLVTRFLSPDSGGQVFELSAATLERTRTIVLGDAPGPDTPDRARGIPNYLSGITISPDAVTAWVPSKQDNMQRGLARDHLPLTHDGAVRPTLSSIDVGGRVEMPGSRVDLNDTSMPLAVEASRHGDLVFIAIQGANRVEVRNAFTGRPVGSVAAGAAPEGLVLDDRGRLFVDDALGRSVTVVDVAAMLAGTDDASTPLATLATLATEPLSAAILRGKQIFHDASDRRMSKESYISCASCHLDGDEDGRVWDFTDRGEGLRNTITLRGRAGMGHGRVHFTANFDEIQDFENDIRKHFGGTGFLDDADWAAGTRQDPLGDPKAGLDADLDALAAYVTSLSDVPRSPYRNADGTLTADAIAGQVIFERLDCRTCHAGPTFTDGKLHDVGTIKTTSGQGSGRPLVGIDTQTLVGVFDTPPYFHDGSARSLYDVLEVDGHGNATALSAKDKDQLVAFLLSLDGSDLGEVEPPEDEQPGCCQTGRGSHPTSAFVLALAVVLGLRRRLR